jgi:hypothetical protein
VTPSKIARTIAAAAVLSVFQSNSSWAQQTLPREVNEWLEQNQICRGSSGPNSEVACSRREVIGSQLEKQGWCYGAPGDAGFDRRWQRCAGASPNSNSLQPADGSQGLRELEKAGLLAGSPQLAAGTYKGRADGDVELTVSGTAPAYDVEISVSTRTGCGGGISGKAQWNPQTRAFQMQAAVQDLTCTLSIFPQSSNTVRLREGPGCYRFHGVACGFEATVTRVNARPTNEAGASPNAARRTGSNSQRTIPADWHGRFRQLDHRSADKNGRCDGAVLTVTQNSVSNGDTEAEELTRVDATKDTLVVRAKSIGNPGENYAGPVRLVRVRSEIHFFVGKIRFGRYDLVPCSFRIG